jgi:hypothetical protein
MFFRKGCTLCGLWWELFCSTRILGSLFRIQLGSYPNLSSFFFYFFFIFFICIVGGWNQGPLDTAATLWPIVSAPGDYDNGEIGGMIGRENWSTRRKPAPVPLCPPQTPHAAQTRTRAAAVGSQCLMNLMNLMNLSFRHAYQTLYLQMYLQFCSSFFFFCIKFRPALGPTQPPIQWVPGAVSTGIKRQGVGLYLHFPIHLQAFVLN